MLNKMDEFCARRDRLKSERQTTIGEEGVDGSMMRETHAVSESFEDVRHLATALPARSGDDRLQYAELATGDREFFLKSSVRRADVS